MKARRTREKATVPARSGPAPARLDRRTKDLTKRLSAGDIAVIKHADIDRVSAEALVACKPVAVINADKSISGRYPNLGPGIIIEAGIPLLDATGPEIFDLVEENAQISITDDTVFLDDEEIATGIVQTQETIGEDMHEAEAGMNSVLVDFVDNTIEYIRKDSDLLSAELVVPEVATNFEGRHALIVVRGYHYKEDLAILGSYIREYRPLLVGVDGGADAILEAGYKPNMIVGDMDSVSDTALTSGAEIVVHAYRDGNAPGTERVHSLGVDCVAFAASGTSEDIAMLLADDKGADLIVAVGTHDTVMEFLDKGRKGMASTFITRLRVGSKLIDAKGVSLLYRQRISSLQLSVLIIAGLVALGVALFATAAGQTLIGLIGAQLDGVFGWIGSLFGGDPAASSESASLIQGLTSD
ncbi:putative cytokinetic ring protein SteA [Brevibacterium sandarakinum]|uniref:putative cytokinetic ring protein SteA n=1 Tax=Brevibacterium sandarakinum TaxID=629680 RepID=UPI002653A950|nr:putative cytokinetic ring protein SteA [Brevibacterium sandarakinum]MDN5658709.1 putative cytokinetic ring protein SteA [Brevibacterium sandarakinum]